MSNWFTPVYRSARSPQPPTPPPSQPPVRQRPDPFIDWFHGLMVRATDRGVEIELLTPVEVAEYVE